MNCYEIRIRCRVLGDDSISAIINTVIFVIQIVLSVVYLVRCPWSFMNIVGITSMAACFAVVVIAAIPSVCNLRPSDGAKWFFFFIGIYLAAVIGSKYPEIAVFVAFFIIIGAVCAAVYAVFASGRSERIATRLPSQNNVPPLMPAPDEQSQNLTGGKKKKKTANKEM